MRNGNWQAIIYLATMLASAAAAGFSAMTRAAIAETRAELITRMQEMERRAEDRYITRQELRALIRSEMQR
jgi:hypothetical protein